MRAGILILLMLFFVTGCKNESSTVKSNLEKSLSGQNTQHKGKQLMEIQCNSCHSPTASEDTRLAPPMIAVKRHYLTEDMSKEEFVEDILSWMQAPSVEKSKMLGAVERFGMMLKMPLKEEDIIQIAEYMYENKLQAPEWFEEHYNQRRRNQK